MPDFQKTARILLLESRTSPLSQSLPGKREHICLPDTFCSMIKQIRLEKRLCPWFGRKHPSAEDSSVLSGKKNG